jgi:hypothetical protein
VQSLAANPIRCVHDEIICASLVNDSDELFQIRRVVRSLFNIERFGLPIGTFGSWFG